MRRATVFWTKYPLQFRKPSGTSRGILSVKDSWFIIYYQPGWIYPAVGECSIIPGLSADPAAAIEAKLDQICYWLNHDLDHAPDLRAFPALRFAVEMLLSDMKSQGNKEHFSNAFTRSAASIPTNGLVWMGPIAEMKKQVRDKIDKGFNCIKLKIGALDFQEECKLLAWIRSEFSTQDPELRLDANGAFHPTNALEKLKQLSAYNIHSIEQPVAPGQRDAMAELCLHSPIAIALDEELIGLDAEALEERVRHIQPKYLILKPTLLGGWRDTNVLIEMAERLHVQWWITSALESNVGLMAIAQYTFEKGVTMAQGLGTGSLYTNNIESPLILEGQNLIVREKHAWNFSKLVP